MTTVLESPTGVRRSDEVVIESLGDTELLDRYVAGRLRVTKLEAENAAMLAEIDRRRAYEPDFFTTEAFLQGRAGDFGTGRP